MEPRLNFCTFSSLDFLGCTGGVADKMTFNGCHGNHRLLYRTVYVYIQVRLYEYYFIIHPSVRKVFFFFSLGIYLNLTISYSFKYDRSFIINITAIIVLYPHDIYYLAKIKMVVRFCAVRNIVRYPELYDKNLSIKPAENK